MVDILTRRAVFHIENGETASKISSQAVKEPQRKLEEFIPMPGKNDFKFETVFFVLISVFYVLGFFYLEGSITGFAVADGLVKSSANFFPIVMGVLNLSLLLLIYLDLRKEKKR